MSARIRVAVLYGGRSSEHSVSCVSAGSIMAHLDPQRYEVIPIGINSQGTWTVGRNTGLEIRDGVLPTVDGEQEIMLSLNPNHRGEIYDVATGQLWATADVVFPVLHGPYGEDGTVQGLLELAGLPYVGPGVLASAAGMDKEVTKKLMAAQGLPITREVVLRAGEELSLEHQEYLGLPVFVKPARGGSSIGISKVASWEQLPAAIELARRSDSKIIIEAAVSGAEVEVGVLELPDGTIVASEPAMLNGTEDSAEGFYGFDTKYLDNTVTATIPAPLPEPVRAELQQMAIATFHALGCKGLSRVDFFVSDSGPVLNEINTMPGFTPISMYPQVFAAGGMSYEQLLDTLLSTALARG